MSGNGRPEEPQGVGPLPLVLVILSFLALMVFQTYLSIADRSNLEALRTAQEPALQEARRLRQQLESLATKTAQLAQDGDPGAQAVAAEMKRLGVTLGGPKP